MAIRPVFPNELEVLRQLASTTFSATFRAQNNPIEFERYLSQSFSAQKIEAEYQNKNSHFYFLVNNGATIGYLKLNEGTAQTEEELENAIEVERIYVLDTFHGQGMGQKLIEKAIVFAKEKKAQWLWLGVWEKNPRAVRFYEKNGFSAFSTHTFLMGTDEQTDLLMRLPLGDEPMD